MTYRIAFVVLAALSLGVGIVACSSSSPETDGGLDASSGDDAQLGDVSIGDAGRDSMALGDATLTGNCSPARGPDCDLVLQDCPSGKECVVALGADGGPTTACQTAGTGNRPLGATCCPGQQNQCVPGLECLGVACTDGGTPSARCAPHCCPGDDSVCGQSVPEGFRGSCDLTIVEDFPPALAVPVFQTCTYKNVCKPFHVQSCPTDYACLLQADNVSFRCDQIYIAPGKAQGAVCTFANDCADGLACLGPSDGGPSTCATLCFQRDGGTPPFDAGGLTDAAGYGGCPAGKGCGGTFIGAPGWLGFCTP